jgi:hypothetical protein
MRKAKIPSTGLPRPLPPTASVPVAGRLFYGANRERSYRLAKAGAIVTMDVGARSKIALLHATARLLKVDFV